MFELQFLKQTIFLTCYWRFQSGPTLKLIWYPIFFQNALNFCTEIIRSIFFISIIFTMDCCFFKKYLSNESTNGLIFNKTFFSYLLKICLCFTTFKLLFSACGIHRWRWCGEQLICFGSKRLSQPIFYCAKSKNKQEKKLLHTSIFSCMKLWCEISKASSRN